jgi:ABC-type xylose transport system permease subunit
MNYAVLMLVVLSIWMVFYFVIDKDIENVITKVDAVTLLILGILFIMIWQDIGYSEGDIFPKIRPIILYLIIAINMMIKGYIFMRNRKINLGGNGLIQRKAD